MASLLVDQLQAKSMFLPMIKSVMNDILNSYGITVNGNGSADFQVKNERIYYRMFKYAIGLDPLAVGEGYMDGDWTCEDLTSLIEKAMSKAPAARKYNFFLNTIPKLMYKASLLLFNLNSKSQCEKDIASHYDIGNDLYRLMLDRTMNYSCGYWQKHVAIDSTEPRDRLCETLEEAQINKMLLIARKLHLKPGMRVLDIGCGWGYCAKFMAVNFGVHVVAISISKEQINYAKTTDVEPDELAFLRIPGLGLDGQGSFEFRLQDYRDVEETFDAIFSVGMFEHVGVGNHNEYFDVCRRCLKPNGLMLLHTIGIGYTKSRQTDPWTNKYIFPGGALPHHTQIVDASDNKFLIEDWHNIGFDYSRTLREWKANFERNWPKLQDKYDERFRLMWTFYLCGSIAGFTSRKFNVWQIVFSKRGLPGGYTSCR